VSLRSFKARPSLIPSWSCSLQRLPRTCSQDASETIGQGLGASSASFHRGASLAGSRSGDGEALPEDFDSHCCKCSRCLRALRCELTSPRRCCCSSANDCLLDKTADLTLRPAASISFSPISLTPVGSRRLGGSPIWPRRMILGSPLIVLLDLSHSPHRYRLRFRLRTLSFAR